jgi:hypothetical protein
MAEAARLDELADTLPPPVEAADVGGDSVNADDTVNGGAPPESEPPSPSPSDDADPLDQLLRQYDDQNGNGAAATDDDIIALLEQDAARQQQEQDFQAAQQRFAADSARAATDIAQRDRQNAELQQTVGQLQQAIQQEVWRQHQQRSAADFEKLISSEQAKLADVAGIDDDHAKRWMLSEAAQDPELQRAWEAKYYTPPGPVERANIASQIQQWGEGQAKLALQLPDPRARVLAQQNIEASMRQMWSQAFPDPATYRANAARYVNKALERMHRDARKPRIDPDATADRFAVAQAVRGASTNKIPAEPAPVWGELTDSQLNAFTKQLGFRAI